VRVCARDEEASLSHWKKRSALDVADEIRRLRSLGLDQRARALTDVLVTKTDPQLRRYLRWRFKPSDALLPDLMQVGRFAVVKSIDTYQRGEGMYSFKTWWQEQAGRAARDLFRYQLADVCVSDRSDRGRGRDPVATRPEVWSRDDAPTSLERAHARADVPHLRLPTAAEMEGATDCLELEVFDAEERRLLRRALAKLSPLHRDLLASYHGIDRPAESVEELRIAYGQPRARVQRALDAAQLELVAEIGRRNSPREKPPETAPISQVGGEKSRATDEGRCGASKDHNGLGGQAATPHGVEMSEGSIRCGAAEQGSGSDTNAPWPERSGFTRGGRWIEAVLSSTESTLRKSATGTSESRTRLSLGSNRSLGRSSTESEDCDSSVSTTKRGSCAISSSSAARGLS
jgi:RNA polymerase sigma factor (sigma-70 family)